MNEMLKKYVILSLLVACTLSHAQENNTYAQYLEYLHNVAIVAKDYGVTQKTCKEIEIIAEDQRAWVQNFYCPFAQDCRQCEPESAFISHQSEHVYISGANVIYFDGYFIKDSNTDFWSFIENSTQEDQLSEGFSESSFKDRLNPTSNSAQKTKKASSIEDTFEHKKY